MAESTEAQIDRIAEQVRLAIACFNALFEEPRQGTRETRDLVHRDLLTVHCELLRAIERELEQLREDEKPAERYYTTIDSKPDSIDYRNCMVREAGKRDYADVFKESVWDAVRDCLPEEKAGAGARAEKRFVHTVFHAGRAFSFGINVIEDYMGLIERLAKNKRKQTTPRLSPASLGSLDDEAELMQFKRRRVSAAKLKAIRECIKKQDEFSSTRSYKAYEGGILPSPLGGIRPVEDFYGYKKERRFLKDQMNTFAESGNRPVRPVLIWGLPGAGKTHMTIAHALSFDDFVLMNADKRQLEEELDRLLSKLSRYHYRRFVLFFDDVDPERVNWSLFRHQVDGHLPVPGNVLMVLASNFEFPARIRGRCNVIEFRPMEVATCMGMVRDYLAKHRWMSQAYQSLVATVTADYVNEYVNGPLNELTPRSLVRYLESLENKPRKIRVLIRDSLEEMTQLPAEEPFYDSNKHIREMMERERQEFVAP